MEKASCSSSCLMAYVRERVSCPCALGFGLILYAGRVFHVAHGAIAIASGYACFFLADGAGAPLILAMPTAILVAAALGMLVEYFVYRPIRGEGERIAVASSTLIIASLGVHVVLTNALALRFGSGSICLCPEAKRTIELGTAVITVVQGAQLAVGLLVACTVWLVLRLTTLGRAFARLRRTPSCWKCEAMTREDCGFQHSVSGPRLPQSAR